MQTQEPLTTNNRDVEALQDLILANIDSREALQEAIPRITDPSLAALFRKWAAQRAAQAAELQSIVAASGKAASHAGTIGGAMERVWMDLKSALGGGTSAILQQIERGEDFIQRKYEDFLTDDRHSPARDSLWLHLAAVKTVHYQVRRMRDQFRT